MDAPLILILVLTFAFAATRLETRLLGARSNILASLEYALIGILVGPKVLGFLNEASLDSLEPLLAVVTGFVGFLVGLPLSWRGLDKRVVGTVRFGLITAFVTAAITGAVTWLVFRYTVIDLGDPTDSAMIGAAATLALGATCVAVETIRGGIFHARADGPVSQLLPGAAQTMRIVSVIGFGLALAAQRGVATGSDAAGALMWMGVEAAAGVAVGFIFFVFVGQERDHKKLFVATIGVVSLGSGIAEALDFSPLFVNLIAGITLANLSPAAKTLLIADARLRRPVFAVLLVLAGASWAPIPGLLWLVPLAFVVLRALSLGIGARIAILLGGSSIDRDTPRPGNAFLGQGAVVIALAVDYVNVTPHSMLSRLVLTTLLVSAVANELWFSATLRTVLQNAGETGRRAANQGPAEGEVDTGLVTDLIVTSHEGGAH